MRTKQKLLNIKIISYLLSNFFLYFFKNKMKKQNKKSIYNVYILLLLILNIGLYIHLTYEFELPFSTHFIISFTLLLPSLTLVFMEFKK